MTKGSLQSSRSSDKDSDSAEEGCWPPQVVLKEENNAIKPIARICKNLHSFQGPKVFHSTLNVVKITYIWQENQSSGFTVDFDFHRYNSSCVHFCDDRSCVSDRQLCNGRYDCADKSDEHSCPPLSQSTGASQSSTNVDLIRAFAVIISVVLMPGIVIIICIVSPCQLRSRMLRRQRRSRERLDHSQLRPDSQVSEVVYVPTSGSPSTSQDYLLEQQISKVREHQIRVRSVQTDTMLDLPPQIPISKDGEEGYIQSQKHLMCKQRQYLDQLLRAPPNRTVHDRESPPPYSSNSTSLETLDKSAMRIVRDAEGYPRTMRCYSMSSNVSPNIGLKTGQRKLTSSSSASSSSEAKTHVRTLSTNSENGRAHTVSVSSTMEECSDEPPDYRGVKPSDIKHNSPLKDSNV